MLVTENLHLDVLGVRNIFFEEDGRIAKVVSWRRGATAYRVGYRDGRVVEDALGSESIRGKRV